MPIQGTEGVKPLSNIDAASARPTGVMLRSTKNLERNKNAVFLFSWIVIYSEQVRSI